MLDSNLEAAVREFANWLAQAQPLVELHRVQEQLEADAEAQQLLIEWDKKQQELLERQRASQAIPLAELEILRQLRTQIQNHPIVRAYSEAQRHAQSYLTDVSMEISQMLGLDFGTLSHALK